MKGRGVGSATVFKRAGAMMTPNFVRFGFDEASTPKGQFNVR